MVPHSNFKISVTLGEIKTNAFGKANYATLIIAKKRTRMGGGVGNVKQLKKLESDAPYCTMLGTKRLLTWKQVLAFESTLANLGV